MPLRIRNADVREGYSKPVIRSDDTAFVDRTTYIAGKPVGTDRIELTADEAREILNAPVQAGMTNGDSLGFAVLALICNTGRSTATWPDDYVAEISDPPPAPEEPAQP